MINGKEKPEYSNLVFIDFSKKENQIGCGYCAHEQDCKIRDCKTNKAKEGCADWLHYSDVDLQPKQPC